MIKKFTKFMKAKEKVSSRVTKRRIKDLPQTSSAMDVEKQDMSMQIVQMAREVKKRKEEFFSRKRLTLLGMESPSTPQTQAIQMNQHISI